MRFVGHRETRPPKRYDAPSCRPRESHSEYAKDRQTQDDIRDVIKCRTLWHDRNLPMEDLVRKTGRDAHWIRNAISYRIYGWLP